MMRKILLLSLMFLSWAQLFADSDSTTFAGTDWNWRKLENGAEVGFAQLHLFDSPQSISVLRYPMKKVGTFLANDSAEKSDSTSALILRHGGIAGINASYFNMKTLYPTTYTKDDGKEEGWTTANELFRVDGVVAMKRGGKKVDIFYADTLSDAPLCSRYKEALAAGPVLLIGGKEARQTWPNSSFYYKRHPRTVIGKTADGMVYLIVIDGRFKGSGIGTTIHETAEIARMFGLCDALNLDGGGSSTLWTKKYGTISHPYDNKKYDHYGQRVVPNVIFIR